MRIKTLAQNGHSMKAEAILDKARERIRLVELAQKLTKGSKQRFG